MQKTHPLYDYNIFCAIEACWAYIIDMISIFYAVTDLVIKHMGRIDEAKL